MKVTFKVQGLRELDKALAELPKAYAKNILRKAFETASEPLVLDIKANTPVRTGQLRDSIEVSRMGGERRNEAKMQVGVMGKFYGHFLEFGTPKLRARPFVRPAIDRNSAALVDRFSEAVAASIERARARLAARAANKEGK